jgi:hypothetical protein
MKYTFDIVFFFLNEKIKRKCSILSMVIPIQYLHYFCTNDNINVLNGISFIVLSSSSFLPSILPSFLLSSFFPPLPSPSCSPSLSLSFFFFLFFFSSSFYCSTGYGIQELLNLGRHSTISKILIPKLPFS